MVEVGTGTKGTRFIATDYPNEEGLTAGTTKQEGTVKQLVPEEGTLVPRERRKGLE